MCAQTKLLLGSRSLTINTHVQPRSVVEPQGVSNAKQNGCGGLVGASLQGCGVVKKR